MSGRRGSSTGTSLKQAVEEARKFFTAFPGLHEDNDVRQLAGCPEPPLTIGAVYAMYQLAESFVEISAEYTPEEVSRALLRRRR
jgi:hypothetical protein